MDAIDILGSLLGHKSSKPGKGTDVLTEIFRGAAKKTSAAPRTADISQQAKELEDLLNVANERQSPPSPLPRQPSSRSRQDTTAREMTSATIDDEHARILVRAMVNAAKSDGQIDQAEQQRILERLQNSSPEAIQFLREEFRKPLDLREFADEVPIGMEQQVYTMSLIAVDLDTDKEAKYLMELAQALRLPMEVREQIHRRLGAPSLY